LMPMVTFNHFTVPRWFAERGGFEAADGADLFARFCDRVARRLGALIGMASTFNEANIVLLRKLIPRYATPAAAENARAMVAAAKRNLNAPAFSSLLFGDPDRVSMGMLDAHAKGYAAIKASAGSVPVGVTLSMQEIEGVDSDTAGPAAEALIYGDWIAAARASDFIGVQTYTRLRVGPKGLLPPPAGAERTAAGYEYRPAAVGATIRYAHRHIGKPVYLTETGIATENDAQRIAFIDATVVEVRRCIAEGVDVKGYIYWSLLDNFEWTNGYGQKFGLVAVDRASFRRTAKPSAAHLGRLAKAGRP
jgi:beta-glucosidase